MGSLSQKIVHGVGEEAQGKVESVLRENAAGLVATQLTSEQKNRNRIKALAKLWDAAKDWGSATAAAGPFGAAYGAAKAGDNLFAGAVQGVTGEETPTIMDHVEKAAVDKAKAAGAWVDKKLDNLRDRLANQLAESERKKNPDGVPDFGPEFFGPE